MMVSRSSRDIESALLRKGFRFADSHHKFLRLFRGTEPQPVQTFLSHGSKEYGDQLLAQVARQLHLTKAELLRLIDCEMSGEDYMTLMLERGHVRP